jgi:peptidoglycan/LPS O-acetylase OafA/YrhL
VVPLVISTQTRAPNLEPLRALAALAVLIGHAYALGGRAIPIQAEHWYDVPLIQTATGVWLFFVISGFVIARPFVAALVSGEPLPQLVPYTIRRIARIYPVYWIALIVTMVWAVGSPGPKKALLHLSLLHNLVPGRQAAVFSVAWTLTIEVLFYITVPFVALLIRRRWGRGPIAPTRLVRAIAITWVVSIVWTSLGAFVDDDTMSLWLRQVFPSMWGSFCSGLLLAVLVSSRDVGLPRSLARLDALLDDRQRALTIAAAIWLLAAWWGSAGVRLFDSLAPGLVVYDLSRPLFAISYGVVVGVVMRSEPWRGPVGQRLQVLGDISYGIYLFHAVFIYLLLYSGLDGIVPLASGIVGYALHVALILCLTLPTAWVSWRLLERPLLGWARTFSQRFSLPPAAATASD